MATAHDTTRHHRDDRAAPARAQDDTRVLSHRTEDGPTHRAGSDPTLVVAVVAGAIALFMLVVGIVTIARTGIPLEGLTDATTQVGPFQRGALMGILEIVVGAGVGRRGRLASGVLADRLRAVRARVRAGVADRAGRLRGHPRRRPRDRAHLPRLRGGLDGRGPVGSRPRRRVLVLGSSAGDERPPLG